MSIRNNLNDDNARKLMNRPPRGMLSWGMWVLAGFVLLLLALAAGIKYPDVLTAEVEIVFGTPPVRIVAKSNGAIARLLVADSAHVVAGQWLAVTDQSANPADLQTLESWLNAFDANQMDDLSPKLSLGPLQPAFANVKYHEERWRLLTRYDDTALRLQSLRRQWNRSRQLDTVAARQLHLLDSTIALADRNYREYASLVPSGAASDLEVENALLLLLQYKKEREQLSALQLGYLQEAERFSVELNTLQSAFRRRHEEEYAAFQAAVGALEGSLAEWKDNWCYIAPVDGIVTLTGLRNNWQYLEEGQEMFAIVPATGHPTATPVAYGILAATGAGALPAGAEAAIRLYDFPYAQYGELPARLKTIATTSTAGNYYNFILSLPSGLTTNSHYTVPVKYGMRGQARLITQRRSFLSRLRSEYRSDGLKPSDRYPPGLKPSDR